MKSFEARWPAECPVCGDYWSRGDALWWLEEDGEKQAVHWYCSPDNSQDAEREGMIERNIGNQQRVVDREGVNCDSCGERIQPGQMWELRGAEPYHEDCE